jgi:hypothetical protein
VLHRLACVDITINAKAGDEADRSLIWFAEGVAAASGDGRDYWIHCYLLRISIIDYANLNRLVHHLFLMCEFPEFTQLFCIDSL